MEALRAWIKEKYGRGRELADHIDRNPAVFHQWKKVPQELVPAISSFTGIPARKLRPDLAELMGVKA